MAVLLFGAGVAVLSLQTVVSVDATPAAFADGANWLGLASLGVAPAATDALRDSTFQWVSALSCTGFQSAPIGSWAAGGKLVLSFAMVLGGAAGSTVGGSKIIRGYTISKGIRWQFSRVFLPSNAVVSVTIDGRHLDRRAMEREFGEAALVSLLWLLLLLTSSLVLVTLTGTEFTYADALFEVASAQGNVGLLTGITGPSMPAAAELMFVFNMWVGRLEIIPVLVFARSVLYGLGPSIRG